MSGDTVRETFAYYLSEAENGWCKIPRRVADDLAQSYTALQQQLSDCKSSLRAAEAELDEAMAEVERWNDDFVNRVVAEHGTTITILAARLDEYAERIRTAEAELNEARAAHKKSTHEAVRRLQALGREKSGVETQLLAAEAREKLVRAALVRLIKIADSGHYRDGTHLSIAAHPAFDDARALASKEGGE